VLSQDQTLMLRIQSRLNHVILNRRELTLISKRITAPKRGVFSCSKRDRRSLFQEPASLPIPQAPPPTFLFLLIFNCQITDQKKPVEIQSPQSQAHNPEPPISIAANQGNTRAKVFVASSAAALVSDRAYKGTSVSRSMADF
ncbi:hypothetical protein, partial [Rhizobium sp. BR 315]|uniref:hypothetical protein n=1 Tax=Rhizobium sp. BR 315 TaxID=3040014 RepID=UPI003D325326